jgi:DNA-binding MarR family transcriptional regulator
MSATRPDTHTSTDVGADTGTDSVQALDPQQLGAYFVLMEAVSLLQHQVEQQLHAEGDISYVQFQLLARLANAHGHLTMTQLADGVVYSRSGLTYQAGLLEKAGLITRAPSSDDERATLVTITENGRALVDRVLPGHIQVTRRLLFDPLTDDDLHHLGEIMTRVRDHMRAQPPRSAAPRKRRAAPAAHEVPDSPSPDTALGAGRDVVVEVEDVVGVVSVLERGQPGQLVAGVGAP